MDAWCGAEGFLGCSRTSDAGIYGVLKGEDSLGFRMTWCWIGFRGWDLGVSRLLGGGLRVLGFRVEVFELRPAMPLLLASGLGLRA